MARIVAAPCCARPRRRLPLAVPPPRPRDSAAAGADAPSHVLETRVLGKSVRGRPITAWHLDNAADGKRKGPTVVLIATMHGNEGAPRQILAVAARRPGDPRRRPVAGAGLQPRRPRRAPPPQRARRRPQPQLPLPLGRPRRELRVGPAPGVRAGDPGDDAVPPRDPSRLRPQLPPAAARRRHRQQAARLLAPGGPHPAPAGHHARLRRGLPRHHDRLVQPPLQGLRAHRRVRRPPARAG